MPGTTVMAQVVDQQTTSGTTRRFNYSITSNYGVSVSSTSTPGYSMEGSASMGILPGSFVKNQAGTGNVVITENGVNISGIDAGLNLNLDPQNTLFKATLKKDNTTTSQTNNSTGGATASDNGGTASVTASGFASTSISAELTDSFQTRTFEKSF